MAARENRIGSKSILLIDGYKFREKSKTAETRYIKCCGSEGRSCSVKGQIKGNGQREFTGQHRHLPPTKEIRKEAFKDRLWRNVVNSQDNLRQIYDRAAQEDPETAIFVPFASIERSMARWRQQNRPPIPSTLAEYDRLINSEEWQKFRTYQGGILTVRTTLVDDETSVTVFGDEIFLTSLQTNELYIDATFNVCPQTPKIQQFLTIMAQVDDVAVPILWVLMTRKNEAAYLAMLRIFNELAPNIQPTIVHQDFEIALRNAVRIIFPNAAIVHCFFHYSQAMLNNLEKKIHQAGMNRLNNWNLGQIFFRKLLALALLPAEDIQRGYNWLIDNTPNDIKQFYAAFLRYYSETWWLTRVRPENFSVFGYERRTNNVIEAYHRVLNTHLGKHIRIWKFTSQICELQLKSWIEVKTLNRGMAVRRSPEGKYIKNQIVVKRAWELYRNGLLTLPRFLSCANHFLLVFRNKFIIETQEQVDSFINTPQHNIDVQPIPIEIAAIRLEGQVAGQVWIPIIGTFAPDENVVIYILEDINQSRCRYCGDSIAEMISLPCQHWLACRTCVEVVVNFSETNGFNLICDTCRMECLVVKIMHIT